MASPDYSPAWYKRHARDYIRFSASMQAEFLESSHAHLCTVADVHARLKQLTPGRRGLDAGCGPGAEDLAQFCGDGYDMVGVDAVEENVSLAHEFHPDLRGRVFVYDLTAPLPFGDSGFDFIICNAVIQHISPEQTYSTVFREFVRVLRAGGVLQLVFKSGSGFAESYYPEFQDKRYFLLYNEQEVLSALQACGMKLIEAPAADMLGGLLHYTGRDQWRYCVMWLRKGSGIQSWR